MKTAIYIVCACVILSSSTGIKAADDDGRPPKKLKIDEQPDDVLVRYGERAEFKVKTILPNVGYQWLHNFEPIKGATEPNFIIEKVSNRDLGAYVCILTKQHNDVHDQAETKSSDPVSLMAYTLKGKNILIDSYIYRTCPPPLDFDLRAKPDQRADVASPFSVESPLLYAVNRSASRIRELGADAPLYFVSTNPFFVPIIPPVGGGGSGSGTCPPAYICHFNFRKTVLPYGWKPATGVTSGSARHVGYNQTVVKWFVGTQSSGCGSGGIVNINFTNPNSVYRFTVFCPSAVFSTCIGGTQQLELTGFQQ